MKLTREMLGIPLSGPIYSATNVVERSPVDLDEFIKRMKRKQK